MRTPHAAGAVRMSCPHLVSAWCSGSPRLRPAACASESSPPPLRAAPTTPLGRGFAGVGGLNARLPIPSLPFTLRVPARSALGASPHPLRAWATPFPARCRLPEGTPSLRSCVGRAAATTCFSFAPLNLAPQSQIRSLRSLLSTAFLLRKKLKKGVAHALRAGDLRG